MTTADERTQAVLATRKTLIALRDDPQVPEQYRQQASQLLVHFPTHMDLAIVASREQLCRLPPPTFGMPQSLNDDSTEGETIPPEELALHNGEDRFCEGLVRALMTAVINRQPQTVLEEIYGERAGNILDTAEWLDRQHGTTGNVPIAQDRLKEIRRTYGIQRKRTTRL